MHAVIFDIDGTLLQSVAVDESLYMEAIRSVLGHVHFRPTWAEYDFVTDSGILSQVLEDNSLPRQASQILEIEHHFLSRFESYLLKNGPLLEVPGSRDHFRALCDSEIHSVAIATGSWRSTAVVKLKSAEFDVTAAPLATCDDSAVRTEIMQMALAMLGSTFESITYYGDGPWDENACRELEWDFVAVGSVLGGIESYLGTGVA